METTTQQGPGGELMIMTTVSREEMMTEVMPKISDDGFAVPGWVELTIGEETIDVHLSNIMPALIGFDAKYSRDEEQHGQE